MRFGSVYETSGQAWDGQDYVAAVVSGLSGVAVVVLGGITALVVRAAEVLVAGGPWFGSQAPPPSVGTNLAWLVGAAMWTAAALIVPVLVAPKRPIIGWTCGCLAALVPLLFLVMCLSEVVTAVTQPA